jgi:hypothetical protein
MSTEMETLELHIMLNRNIDIDATHSRAICTEIGERLRVSLSLGQSEPPQSIRRQLNRLRQLDEEISPSIVPSTQEM